MRGGGSGRHAARTAADSSRQQRVRCKQVKRIPGGLDVADGRLRHRGVVPHGRRPGEARGSGADRGEKKAKFKARCCTNIITQVVRRAVEEWAARASSQGQSRQPAIIIAGDVNTPQAFLEAMGVLQLDEDVEINAPYTGNLYVITDREVQHCEGLPLIKGPDNQHEAALSELSDGPSR